MSARPLKCTRCGSQVGIAEDGTCHIDWGPAVIDESGTVHPADPEGLGFHKGDPIRVRAVCPNPDCRHGWTLRRRFAPATTKES